MNKFKIREEVKFIYPNCVVCNNGHLEKRTDKEWYTNITLHHIIPKSKKGADDVSNLISICRNCHDHYHNYLSKLHIQLETHGQFIASLINFIKLYERYDFIKFLFNKLDNQYKEKRTYNQDIIIKIYNIMVNNIYKITEEVDIDIDVSDLYDIYLDLSKRINIRKDIIYPFGVKFEYLNSPENLEQEIYSRFKKKN